MAPNKKKEALGRQYNQTFLELDCIGFGVLAGLFASTPGTAYGSKINDPDTWTSPLADDQADYTKTDVDTLWSVFTSFLHALDEEHRSEPLEVGERDKEAWWPDAVPDEVSESSSDDEEDTMPGDEEEDY